MDDLKTARTLLEKEGYSCVICRGDWLHTSTQRGVKPLMELLGENLTGASAADKVVGKATALLYCLLGVRRVHAQVISQAAAEVLNAHGIEATWDREVPYIRNREGTGRCPMELATAQISDPADAPAAIRAKLKELQS